MRFKTIKLPSILLLLLTQLPLSGPKIETAPTDRDRIIQIATAMDHLTVIEVSEPITMVAAGSEAFKIERRDNKVFIQPQEKDQSTNLFIWTTSSRYAYELVPAGSVEKMHFAIDYPQLNLAKLPLPGPLASQADLKETMVKAFGLSRLITRRGQRGPDSPVELVITEILPIQDRLLVRYVVQNLGRSPYQPGKPEILLLQSPKSPVSLHSLRNSQLDEKTSRQILCRQPVHLEVLETAASSELLWPGEERSGWVAFKPAAPRDTPTVLRITLGSNSRQSVSATVVL